MVNYSYEIHRMGNPLLPFIYHPRMRVSQRHSLPNWHENIELLCCMEGRGYIQCGPDVFPFTPGVIFVVNPNTPHCVASESAVRYRCLIVDSTFCADNGIPIASRSAFDALLSVELVTNVMSMPEWAEPSLTISGNIECSLSPSV